MLEQQVIPRLLARSGAPTTIFLKRFHSYGLGNRMLMRCCPASRNWRPMAA